MIGASVMLLMINVWESIHGGSPRWSKLVYPFGMLLMGLALLDADRGRWYTIGTIIGSGLIVIGVVLDW